MMMRGNRCERDLMPRCNHHRHRSIDDEQQYQAAQIGKQPTKKANQTALDVFPAAPGK